MKKLLLTSASVLLAFGAASSMAHVSTLNTELGRSTAAGVPSKLATEVKSLLEAEIMAKNTATITYKTQQLDTTEDNSGKGFNAISCGNSDDGHVVCTLDLIKGSGCATNHTVWAVLHNGSTPVTSISDFHGSGFGGANFKYAVCEGTFAQQAAGGGQGTASTEVTKCVDEKTNAEELTNQLANIGYLVKADSPESLCLTFSETLLGTSD